MMPSYFYGQMKLKRTHEKVVRTTISMPPLLLDYGMRAAKTGGFATFSAYVQALLRDRANLRSTQQQLF